MKLRHGMLVCAIVSSTAVSACRRRSSGSESSSSSTNSVAGTWNSVFGGGTAGGAPITVTLVQSGLNVTGSWQEVPGAVRTPPGTLTAVLNGNEVQGVWQDVIGNSGTFRLTFTPDMRSFSGNWASSTLSGPWTGVRAN